MSPRRVVVRVVSPGRHPVTILDTGPAQTAVLERPGRISPPPAPVEGVGGEGGGGGFFRIARPAFQGSGFQNDAFQEGGRPPEFSGFLFGDFPFGDVPFGGS